MEQLKFESRVDPATLFLLFFQLTENKEEKMFVTVSKNSSVTL